MFCSDKGSGPAVILIHGYPLNHRIWRHQLIFKDTHRVLAPDLPGFGQSAGEAVDTMDAYADLIARLMDRLKIQTAVVLGHSMGGYIALAFAERYRHRLSGLGLLCSRVIADSEETRANRMHTIARIQSGEKDAVTAAMKEKLLAPDNLNHSDASRELDTIFREATAEGMIGALRAMAGRKDQTRLAATLEIPILLIAGRYDMLVPLSEYRETKNLNPLIHYHEIDGAGHLAMMENPGAVNAAIKNFLSNLKFFE